MDGACMAIWTQKADSANLHNRISQPLRKVWYRTLGKIEVTRSESGDKSQNLVGDASNI
jgi:hypothetical protein